MFGLSNATSFINNVGGNIKIDRTSFAGLYNRTFGSFTNFAQITIGANSTIYDGVYNLGTFNNTGCGALLNVVGSMTDQHDGVLTNSGSIIENTSLNSLITTNSGLVRNLGGGNFTITNNTGVLTTAPGSAGVSVSASPSLTINQGQTTNLTASGATSYTWSTGQITPTISVSVAGTYSVTGTLSSCSSVTSVVVTVLNTPTIMGFAVSPNPVVVGQPILFTATVGNFSGSYSYTLSNGSSTTTSTSSNTAFSQESIASISSPQTYTLTVVNNDRPPGWATTSLTVVNDFTWTGSTSTNWNTASNWYPAKVPVASDHVVIPPTPVNQPVISTTAVARSVNVNSGASLSITAGGSLSINSSRSVNRALTAFYNSGTVTNEGQFIIGRNAYAGEYGLWNQGGTVNNNTGGIITIDWTSQTALYNQSGNFTNSGKINIGTITTVGNYGLYNQATFTNTGCGALINVVANARITDAGSGTLTNSGTIIENASLSSNITNNSGLVRNLNGSSFAITTNTGVLTTAPGGAGVSISVSPSLTINQGQSATLTASGAVGYNWASGQSTSAISVSVAGTYSVTGTLGSCTSVTSVVVRAPISLTTSASPNTICMGGSVALSVTTKGSSSPYSYSWVAPAGVTLSATNASAVTGIASTSLSGVKTFTVSVAGSDDMPISTTTVSITVSVPPTASIGPLNAMLTCANPTRNLLASGGATYRWDNNVTTEIRSVSVAGTYSVTVSSATGCTATASRTITSNTTPPPASISPSIGTPTGATLTCATPTVSLTASGGTTYRWENNTTTSIRSVSVAGTYSVTVTGANGCTATASFSVSSIAIEPMYTLKTGLWSDVSVWSCGRLPLGSDVLQIKHVVTIPANYIGYAAKFNLEAFQKIIFSAGSRLRLGQ
ncbi:hypothetical protein GCM10028807_62270 [Spirosoma daeguense]